jgi:putative oxidoreductase
MIKIYRLMSFGLLPIRIIAGIGFIINGLPKLVNITGTETEFATNFGLPAALALPVGLLGVGWKFESGRMIHRMRISPLLSFNYF